MKINRIYTDDIIDLMFDDVCMKGHIEKYNMLDKLCKKIDVVGSIYMSYTNNLSKANCKIPLPTKSYVKLLEVLLHCSEYEKDLKFLNSSLKLFDKIKGRVNLKKSEMYQDRINKILMSIE
jgi:hypothetical protein